ncbi:cucumber peeling cupredoxin-like [Senna tora]|uniref:Cucumber peeling cupredoxin-like n=1 Tax=Senna tora TaxID=362788 RepID=A0A834W718_9FABA|nr:cucumber peeling cupredoxin-like [Senna tora]
MFQLKRNPFVLSFSPLILLLLLSLFFLSSSSSSATQFTVGDSSGWAIPPYPSFYTNWSKSQSFKVGDSLEFNFNAKFYNLVQVSEYEYEYCSSLNAVRLFNKSPAIIPLSKRGKFFFICNISNYCCSGQKIAISVHESSSQTPPSPSPSPSPPPPASATSPSSPPIGPCCTVATSPSPSPSESSINSMPSPSSNGNGGYNSPEPSTRDVGEKSIGVSLQQATNFSFSVKNLFSMFATLLAFLIV